MYYATLENRIDAFYRQHHVLHPTDISLYLWDSVVQIDVIYRPGQTDAITLCGKRHVFIDRRQPLADRRAQLAHEIGHALLHTGNQLVLDNAWRLKQEWQANQFAYYALVPTYLLLPYITPYEDNRCRLIDELAEVFCVPLPFMAARLDLLQERLEAEHSERVAETASRYR